MSEAYRRRPTNVVMPVGMNYLSDLVIRPGIEKKFGPLLLYRGQMVLQPDVGRAEAIRIFCIPLETIVRRLKILLRGLAVYFGYSTDIGGYDKFSAAELALQKYKIAWQATMAPEKMNIEAIRRTLACLDKAHPA